MKYVIHLNSRTEPVQQCYHIVLNIQQSMTWMMTLRCDWKILHFVQAINLRTQSFTFIVSHVLGKRVQRNMLHTRSTWMF